MTEQEQIAAAKKFSIEWNGKGDELSDTQHFWTNLLRNVFGVEEPFNIINFEHNVKVDGTSHRIDAFIRTTKILIEQKSHGVDLTGPVRQSDGAELTPYQQARRYYDNLPYPERPRWIVVCNFQEFHIYYMRVREIIDLEYLGVNDVTLDDEILKWYAPAVIKLDDLEYSYKNLKFLVDPNDDNFKPDVKLSKDAVKVIYAIYKIFEKYYLRVTPNYKDSLCKLCVRLVFCFYAQSSHLFKNANFLDYINNFNRKNLNVALQDLFTAFNEPKNLRGADIDDDAKKFPYVNGGLFSERIDIPDTDRDFATVIQRALITDVDNFDFRTLSWRLIEPAIFGAMFESVINDENRRAGGMHYTSVENIHKVIDPLFLDDLHAEFQAAKNKRKRNRVAALQNFQAKLASLKFLDPACGSGNFLTETYLSLRKLENEVLRELKKFQFTLFHDPVKVSIEQFYGIEINEFAVVVAQVALWIAENQMLRETGHILGKDLDGLPLKSKANISRDNALRVDWSTIVPRDKLNYIIGNPPFVGKTFQSKEQKSDMAMLLGNIQGYGNFDYVVSWYYKAAEFIHGTNIRCAFVSTNSITQGEQVAIVWKPLLDKIHIDFAYRTFKWQSESEGMANVYCVIISTSENYHGKKFIFDGDEKIPAQNINPYLIDADNIFVESRTTPLCNVPAMIAGGKPVENGNLIIEADDYDYFIKAEPHAKKYIRPLIGGYEFIKGKMRYCLWLVDVPMDEIKSMPLVYERVEKVRQFRLASKKPATRADADRPNEFQEINEQTTNYIVIPETSSSDRIYIPMGFIPANVISTNLVRLIPNATIYHFGVLTSIVHMAWMRVVCGRLGDGYRYSNTLVYNNFVWCKPTPEQRRLIEVTAQNILDVRARYEGWTLAELYNEKKQNNDKEMPSDLREAHEANDAAVMAAYGFRADMTEAEIVAELMKKYACLAEKK